MLVNERKRKYEEFVKWIKEDWQYNIPGTPYSKILEGSKRSFKSLALQGLKDQGKFDEIIEQSNFKKLFELLFSYELADKGDGFRKFWVDNENVSNVYFDKKNKKIKIYLYVSEDASYAIAKSHVDKIYSLIRDVRSDELKDLGFSMQFYRFIEEARHEEFNFDENFDFKVFRLTRKDSSNSQHLEFDFPEFSVTDIFCKIKYNELANVTDNNNTFSLSISNSSHPYIDIQKDAQNTSVDRVFIAPIKISELVHFVDSVEKRLQSIDSLFTLNVRDRKNKNKVTQAIIDSVKERPENFLMLNNGITAIVNSIKETTEDGKTRLTLNNIQIINGQQTTFTLYNEWYTNKSIELEAAYDKAYILIKAYNVNKLHKNKTKFFNAISNASNSQTAIKSKDLMSTRSFNHKLRDELLHLGINYSYRDGKSDFGEQFKNLPKTNLNKLVKMHYIFLTNEVWKRGSIGQVFDTLTGMSKPQKTNQLSKYKALFDSKKDEDLSVELARIARLQLFYEAKKEQLGKETQALDLLVYVALVLEENNLPSDIDVSEFTKICSQIIGEADRNNFYKSGKHLPKLVIKLFETYGLTQTQNYIYFKNL